MHRPLLILALLCNVFLAFSQESVPLEKRAVLGTIVNVREEVVMGATVSLTSPLHTMQTSTNQHGSFRFDDVRSADFLVVVESMGYSNYNRRYFNNDTKHIVHIPTIRLGIKVEELEEVMISRLRGSVVRGDTTEYWARDYIV